MNHLPFTPYEKERMEKDMREAKQQIEHLEGILRDARTAYTILEKQYKLFVKEMKKAGMRF